MESGNVADSVDKSDVHWYHPPVNEQNILMSLYVNGKVYRSRSIPERFQLARDVASNAYILTITDVRLSDTADYICGIWGKIFGTGTRLNVTSANAPVIIQSPSLERVTEGQTARLQCTMRKATVRDVDVHWYRQLPGQDMEWVLTHDVMNNTRGGPGSTDRFQPSRDIANNSFILTITDVQPNDTAVYYCKVWGDISGNGTQLNITISEAQVDRDVKTTLVWIILGAVLGVTVITGGILLIRYKLFGKKQSPSSGTAGDQDTTADYENISCARDTRNSGDRPADSNATYMALQRPDQSIYSDLKG
ncbi:uncharacterized protein [Heptranchias perlo]